MGQHSGFSLLWIRRARLSGRSVAILTGSAPNQEQTMKFMLIANATVSASNK
jgi:hypothetical protein